MPRPEGNYTSRLLIVVTEAAATQMNTHAKVMDSAGGERTFRIKLSPTGRLPATHRWCSWSLRPAQAAALTTRVGGLADGTRVRVFPGSADPNEVLAQLGLKRIETGGPV